MISAGLRCCAFALVAGCIAAAAAQTGPPPAALAEAVAATQAAKRDYAFDLEVNASKQIWRARYAPAATPRLRLIEPDRGSLDESARRQFDQLAESSEGVTWCAGENLAGIEDLRLVREDAGSATFAFRPSAEMMRQGRGGQNARSRSGAQGAAFLRRMRGELTLTKQDPDITHMRIFTPEAFSPMPLVRLERMSFTISCAPAPNGRRYAAETVMEFAGSAFGRSFNERTVQRASNLSQ